MSLPLPDPGPARWILASSSPRRRRLLESIGLRVEIEAPETDEAVLPAEHPEAHVRRLAAAKAAVVCSRLAPGEAALVLAADTVVVLDGAILGKPRDRDEATSMLASLAGRWHEVWTGMALRRAPQGIQSLRVVRTRVSFRPLSAEWIRWYVDTGEPMDKAGGYGAQGKGAVLLDRIEGSWTAVVGLAVERLPEMADEVGADLLRSLGQSPPPAAPPTTSR